jgi:DMSO/TMAO reductase YedYZ molybdopterin-dependent catalytic subunit
MELPTGVRMAHNGSFLRVPDRGVHELTSFVTEDKSLFLLAHMGLAEVDRDSWRLSVKGLVRNAVSLSFADLHINLR